MSAQRKGTSKTSIDDEAEPESSSEPESSPSKAVVGIPKGYTDRIPPEVAKRTDKELKAMMLSIAEHGRSSQYTLKQLTTWRPRESAICSSFKIL